MQKNLTAIHMLNGAIVLGFVESENDRSIVVRNPLNLLIQPKQGSVEMGFTTLGMPFYQRPKEQPSTFDISRATILYTHDLNPSLPAHKDIINAHAAEFSGIIMNVAGASMQVPR